MPGAEIHRRNQRKTPSRSKLAQALRGEKALAFYNDHSRANTLANAIMLSQEIAGLKRCGRFIK